MLFTEEEKAEAREFEEDQVAGRLKEDVVRVAGWCWEEGVVPGNCGWQRRFPGGGARGSRNLCQSGSRGPPGNGKTLFQAFWPHCVLVHGQIQPFKLQTCAPLIIAGKV